MMVAMALVWVLVIGLTVWAVNRLFPAREPPRGGREGGVPQTGGIHDTGFEPLRGSIGPGQEAAGGPSGPETEEPPQANRAFPGTDGR